MTDLLTIREVCEVLKISRRQLQRIRHRLPPAVMLGNHSPRWRLSDIENWIKKAA